MSLYPRAFVLDGNVIDLDLVYMVSCMWTTKSPDTLRFNVYFSGAPQPYTFSFPASDKGIALIAHADLIAKWTTPPVPPPVEEEP